VIERQGDDEGSQTINGATPHTHFPIIIMLEYITQGFQGYATQYSPFFDNRIAVATAANYGLVGNGRLFILELTPQGIKPMKW
jgi:hypothetical protein